jgi:hypothetical protein
MSIGGRQEESQVFLKGVTKILLDPNEEIITTKAKKTHKDYLLCSSCAFFAFVVKKYLVRN